LAIRSDSGSLARFSLSLQVFDISVQIIPAFVLRNIPDFFIKAVVPGRVGGVVILAFPNASTVFEL
jgi:hypothetical protein